MFLSHFAYGHAYCIEEEEDKQWHNVPAQQSDCGLGHGFARIFHRSIEFLPCRTEFMLCGPDFLLFLLDWKLVRLGESCGGPLADNLTVVQEHEARIGA